MKVLVVGLGLLGASLTLGLKRRGGHETRALGRDGSRLDAARAAGVVDIAGTDPAALVPGADLVVLCTPVGSIPEMAERIAPHLDEGAAVTDIGSCKEWVCRGVARAFGARAPRFLGAHPMAGSEKAGWEHARDDLLDGAAVVLTPTGDEDADAAARVEGFWRLFTGRISSFSPAAHDELVALTSHLPHAAAFALAFTLANRPEAEVNFHGIYGRGLVDTLRIAASDPVMWEDILKTNRVRIAEALERYQETLGILGNWIRTGRGDEIGRLLSVARELSNRL